MSISESNHEDETADEDSDKEQFENQDIPDEFIDLYKDEELRKTLIDLIHSAADLDILDFKEFCRHIDTPKPSWTKTQATTGKHIPVYWVLMSWKKETIWKHPVNTMSNHMYVSY